MRFEAHKHWVFVETANEVCDAKEIYRCERRFYVIESRRRALSSSRSVGSLYGKGQFCCDFAEMSSGLKFHAGGVEQKRVVAASWHGFCPIVIVQVEQKGGKSRV